MDVYTAAVAPTFHVGVGRGMQHIPEQEGADN